MNLRIISSFKRLLWRINKSQIKTVYEDDFVDFIKSLGLDDDISSGNLKCKNCGKTITMETIEILMPEGDEIIAICSNNKCIEKSG